MRDKVTYMEESKFVALTNTDRVNVLLICIKDKQGELSGNIVNFYLKEPVEFTDILGLVLRIDILYARLHRPTAATEPRSLNVYMKEAYVEWKLGREHTPLKYRTKIQNVNRFMALGTGAYETLVTEIHQRQFSSMQERIKSKCSKENYISFRSALELVGVLREYECIQGVQTGNKKRGKISESEKRWSIPAKDYFHIAGRQRLALT